MNTIQYPRLWWLIGLLLSGCQGADTVYDSFHSWESASWAYESPVSYRFQISNPSQPYQLDLSTRYADQYQYANLFVRYELLDSSGAKLNAGMKEIQLFDDTTGKPLGQGTSNVYLTTTPLLRQAEFPYAGAYELKIRHYMRPDVVEDLLALGLTIKAKPNK